MRLLGPLREKIVLNRLFPVRSFLPPTSLDEVLRQATRLIMAKKSKDTVVSMDAATIRALFLEDLMHATDEVWSVCPELARVFPTTHEAKCTVCRDDQYVDVYVGGRVAWGIQLRGRFTAPAPICACECGHPAPFSEQGRYRILQVSDHRTVVVDVAAEIDGLSPISGVRVIPAKVKSATSSMAEGTRKKKRLKTPVHDATDSEANKSTATEPRRSVAVAVKPPIPPHEWLGEPRTERIQHMRRLLFDNDTPHRLIYLSGPHGIGKSGVVRLFQRQLKYDGVDVAWHDINDDITPEGIAPLTAITFAMRRDARIDLVGDRADLQPASPSTMHVVWLDDAHLVFDDAEFWRALGRATGSKAWLPSNVRFIIAATTLKPTSVVPSMLKTFPRIDAEALALTDERAREYLLGTPDEGSDNNGGQRCLQLQEWTFLADRLVDVLIRASNGSIGLIQALAKGTRSPAIDVPKRSESELVRGFFSKQMSKRMTDALRINRVYCRLRLGSIRSWPTEYKDIIISIATAGRCFATVAQGTLGESPDAESEFEKLIDLGLVALTPDTTTTTERVGRRLEFTSPCAKRLVLAFASDGVSLGGVTPPPSTPSALVYSILRQIGAQGRSTEATTTTATRATSTDVSVMRFFEHFIEAIVDSRSFDAEFYPEMQDVFAPSVSEANTFVGEPRDGTTLEIDLLYKIEGQVCWGLQVRITDRDPRTLPPPVERFSHGLRYGVVEVDDFVVVDIALVATGAKLCPAKLVRQPKRMAVDYDMGRNKLKSSRYE